MSNTHLFTLIYKYYNELTEESNAQTEHAAQVLENVTPLDSKTFCQEVTLNSDIGFTDKNKLV